MFKKIREIHDNAVIIENQNSEGFLFIFNLIGALKDFKNKDL